MEILKLTDELKNSLEVFFEELSDGEDGIVPSAGFNIKVDDIDAFFNITEPDDLDELMAWLSEIRERMNETN